MNVYNMATSQENKKMITLTEEQKNIVDKASQLKQGEIIVVNALAGCAKTSTLKLIAENNLNHRFLYLAFNRKIVDEANTKFPSNTKASTLHALARAYTGKKDLKYLNIDTIAEILQSNISDKTQFFRVFNALKAYQAYCQSAFAMYELDDLKKDIRHKLEKDFSRKPDNNSMEFVINQRLLGIDEVDYIHQKILDSQFTTFDTFLKEFVETAENRTFNYDYIVLDEAQDVSKLLAKFIISLVNANCYKIIIVGDDSQKIYGFLGNTNLSNVIIRLYKEHVVPTKSLTKSFRFQKNSAMEILSNQLLNLRNETIIGARKTIPEKSAQDRVAYLSRATFALLAMAIFQIKEGKQYHLYGGINNFNISEIKDIYNLYRHTKALKEQLYHTGFDQLSVESKIELLAKLKTTIPFPYIISKSLKPFSSFFELQVFASSKAIFEIENSISIVHFIHAKKKTLESINTGSQQHLVDQFFSLIEAHSNENNKTILSTIHKAKGLEFESVTILKAITISFDIFTDEAITSTTDDGYILGLERTNLASSLGNISNIELVNVLNEESETSGNIFNTKNTEEKRRSNNDQKDYTQEVMNNKAENSKQKITNELIINKKMADIKEEYNILYVAITRAIREIKISNANYVETLIFLAFINENKEELIKITQNKTSTLLVKFKKKEGKKDKKDQEGIIYQDSFISKETLVDFLNIL